MKFRKSHIVRYRKMFALCCCMIVLLVAIFVVPVHAATTTHFVHGHASYSEMVSNQITECFTLDVTPTKQISQSLCSAATVWQTAYYLSDGAFNQNQVQIGMSMGLSGTLSGQSGTFALNESNYASLNITNATSGKMNNYLNNRVSSWGTTTYTVITNATLNAKTGGTYTYTDEMLAERIRTNLHQFKPLFCSVKQLAGPDDWDWLYGKGNSGHFLTICGLAKVNGQYRICVADPFYQWQFPNDPVSKSVYWVSMDTLRTENQLNSLCY